MNQNTSGVCSGFPAKEEAEQKGSGRDGEDDRGESELPSLGAGVDKMLNLNAEKMNDTSDLAAVGTGRAERIYFLYIGNSEW